MIEYRNGNDRERVLRKQPGIRTYTPIVMRRGVTGDLSLWEWFDSAGRGDDVDRRAVRVDPRGSRAGVSTHPPLALPGPAEVVLDIDVVDGGIFLVVHNLGGAVAHDVTVAFKPDLVGVGGQVISALPLWKRLRTLRPGKEIRVFLNTTHALLSERRNRQQFSAVVAWRVDRKRVTPRIYQHDIGAFAGLPDVIS